MSTTSMLTNGVNRRRDHSVEELTIGLGPKHLENPSKLKANENKMLKFYLKTSSGMISGEACVPQSHFMAETSIKLPHILDFDDSDESVNYNFRTLLDVSEEVNVDAQWEAFACFIEWLDKGVYDSFQNDWTHIDAYIISKRLQSPRFGNAVMDFIIATMPTRKFDEGLTERYRQIFEHCEKACALRILYFETAVFWKMSYGKTDRRYSDGPTHGEGILYLDAVEDEALIKVLENHREEFCPCTKEDSENRKAAALKGKNGVKHDEDVKLGTKSSDDGCICRSAPWIRDPDRFFIAT